MAPMARAALILALSTLILSGCAGTPSTIKPRVGSVPYEWDEEAPDRSYLATEPYYVLSQSSSFLVKGSSYARYIVRVDRTYESVELFFTSTNRYAPGVRGPAVNDDEYHYELMQIRPLGKSVRVMDVSAGPAFSNASTGHTFTLAYIYGRGANYQYLVPYEGNPGRWRLDPGFHEVIVATDEELTVGVNIKLGTPLWSTYYHPQELGRSRSEGLHSYVRVWPGATPRTLRESYDEIVSAGAGESLNYFAFSNLIFRSNLAAIGTQGTVRVSVDGKEVPHRLQATGVNPGSPDRREAFAYAVSFNEPGPARHFLRTQLEFDQTVSLDSDLAAQMLVFAVVVKPVYSLDGLPTAPA